MGLFDDKAAWQRTIDRCEAQRPSKGKRVRVTEGKRAGTVGTVIYHGVSKLPSAGWRYRTNAQAHMADIRGRHGYFCRVETAPGESFTVAGECVEVIDADGNPIPTPDWADLEPIRFTVTTTWGATGEERDAAIKAAAEEQGIPYTPEKWFIGSSGGIQPSEINASGEIWWVVENQAARDQWDNDYSDGDDLFVKVDM